MSSGVELPIWLKVYGGAWSILLPLLRRLYRADLVLRRWRLAGIPLQWGLGPRLLKILPLDPLRPALWIHGASLGESKGIQGILRALRWKGQVLVTCQTHAAVDFWRETSQPGWVVRLAPFDAPQLQRHLFRDFRFEALVIYEMELWPGCIQAATEARVPVLWISARLHSKGLQRMLRWSRPFSWMMAQMTWIQSQGDRDRERLRALCDRPIEVGVDFKAALYLNRPRAISSEQPKGFTFYCVHRGEMAKVLLAAFPLAQKGPVYVIPRFPHEAGAFLRQLGQSRFVLESNAPESGAEWVIVDSYGKVNPYLERSHSVFVGGSWISRGGHNLWEPLLAGCALWTGPHHYAQESLAEELIELGLLKIALEPTDLLARPSVDRQQRRSRAELLLEQYQGRLEHSISRLRSRLVAACGREPTF